MAASPREVLVNGKAPGETSLVIWQQGGNRILFDLHVQPSTLREQALQRELTKELPGQDVTVSLQDGNVFLRGTVPDLTSAERALSIASTLGKPVNLLRVTVPPVDPQVLLKVRFADVDRAATSDLGINIFSTGALNTIGATSTGAFTPPRLTVPSNAATEVTLSDALNIFLFRRDIDLGATIRALQTKRLAQILAEPNLLAINGKQASFLAGGEFPYPTLQGGGGGLGAVTIQFREFGIRLNFQPTVTPRDTIRLVVTPEVSALDYANGLVFQGFTIPGLNTRRVTTEIELENKQSFAIAGLLDNRLTETLSKVPGLGDIPLLGRLFKSRSQNRNNTELLVLVTPELVRPIPADQKPPDVPMPQPFLKDAPNVERRTPGMEKTGPVPVKPRQPSLPVEQLMESQKSAPAAAPQQPLLQFVPVPVYPNPLQMQQPVVPLPAPQPAPSKPPGEGGGGSTG